MLIKKETTTTRVDETTGEQVVETKKKYYSAFKKPVEPFCLFYEDSFSALATAGLSASDWNMLFIVAARVVLNAGTVDIRKEAVRQITEKYGMSRSAIFNALHKLCDADILKKGEESGTYHINPLVFWKGNAWDRTKALRLYMQL